MEIQMALFKWYKMYSVNNNELDEHHRTLFGIFNRMYDRSLCCESANGIDPILKELISYSTNHFSAEEQFMKDIGYKEINKHILEHTDFTQRILQLKQVADKNVPKASKELIVHLKNWFINHIIIEDKKYSIY
jgi:hemerythrin-like metal-binding protein